MNFSQKWLKTLHEYILYDYHSLNEADWLLSLYINLEINHKHYNLKFKLIPLEIVILFKCIVNIQPFSLVFKEKKYLNQKQKQPK